MPIHHTGLVILSSFYTRVPNDLLTSKYQNLSSLREFGNIRPVLKRIGVKPSNYKFQQAFRTTLELYLANNIFCSFSYPRSYSIVITQNNVNTKTENRVLLCRGGGVSAMPGPQASKRPLLPSGSPKI